jgi:hypothetical protein
MSAIKLATPSSGSISLSPENTASNLTITVPAVTATMATLTTPSFVSTIGVGGATPAASGAGITFPATQSASSDANTLDDYEEGTWTPTIGGNTTYSKQLGRYTKIGNKVFIECTMVINSLNSPLTTGDILGLPFTSNASEPQGTVAVGYWEGSATSLVYMGGTIGPNGTAINLRGTGSSSVSLNAVNFFKSGTVIYLTGQYTV